MLREDRKAEFMPAGPFGRRRRFVCGEHEAPLAVSARRLRSMVERSEAQPLRLLDAERDSWWLWRGRIYREDERLSDEDVLALLTERERNRQRRLERAKAGLHGARSTATRSTLPRDVKLKVWERDEGRCVECGSNRLLEFDHVIPLAMGGSDNARNLQILCADCNRRKGNRL